MKEINFNKGEKQITKTNTKNGPDKKTRKKDELWLSYARVSSIQQVTD
jgi:hypothetical protein